MVRLNDESKLSLKKKKVNCCSSGCGCDDFTLTKREILIEFLYLDLNTCTRCKGADAILEEALNELENIFTLTGVEIKLKKVNVDTLDLAKEYKFLSSPTIRVNGKDIQREIKESYCESCGDICNDSVDCRVWTYQGVEYNNPPKGLIVEQLIKHIYCDLSAEIYADEYTVPDNLEKFFKSSKKKTSCC